MAIVPLWLVIHVVQKYHTGEQKMHWDCQTNKNYHKIWKNVSSVCCLALEYFFLIPWRTAIKDTWNQKSKTSTHLLVYTELYIRFRNGHAGFSWTALQSGVACEHCRHWKVRCQVQQSESIVVIVSPFLKANMYCVLFGYNIVRGPSAFPQRKIFHTYGLPLRSNVRKALERFPGAFSLLAL